MMYSQEFKGHSCSSQPDHPRPETVRGALEDAAVKLSTIGKALGEISPLKAHRNVQGNDEWDNPIYAAENPIYSADSMITPRETASIEPLQHQTPPPGRISSPGTKNTPPRTPGSTQKVEANVFPSSFPVTEAPTGARPKGTLMGLDGGLAGWMRRQKVLFSQSAQHPHKGDPAEPEAAPQQGSESVSRASSAAASASNGVTGLRWIVVVLLICLGLVSIVSIATPAAMLRIPTAPAALATWHKYAPVQIRDLGNGGWQDLVSDTWKRIHSQSRSKAASISEWMSLADVKTSADKPNGEQNHLSVPGPSQPAPKSKPALTLDKPPSLKTPAKKKTEAVKVAGLQKSKQAVPTQQAAEQPDQKRKHATKMVKVETPKLSYPSLGSLIQAFRSLWNGWRPERVTREVPVLAPAWRPSMPAVAVLAGAAGASLAAGIVAAMLRRATGTLTQVPLGPTTTPIVGGRVSRSRSRSRSAQKSLPTRSPVRQRSVSRSRKTPKRIPSSKSAALDAAETPRTRLDDVLDTQFVQEGKRGRAGTRRSSRV